MFLKKVVALFILLAVLMQAVNRYILIADYYIHMSCYIQTCVNKKMTGMHCNGRCQLNKKLKQQENSDKQNRERKSTDHKGNPLSSKSWFANSLLLCLDNERTCYPKFNCGKTEIRPRLYFHPPDFLLS